MSLIEQIEADVKESMLARDAERRDALRLILSSLRSAEKDLQRPLTNDEELQVLQRERKKRIEETPSDVASPSIFLAVWGRGRATRRWIGSAGSVSEARSNRKVMPPGPMETTVAFPRGPLTMPASKRSPDSSVRASVGSDR